MYIVLAIIIALVAFKIVTKASKRSNLVDSTIETGRAFIEDARSRISSCRRQEGTQHNYDRI